MTENKKYTKIQELTYELKVKDVMNRSVVTVGPKKTIYELREIFRKNRFSGTPVEDKGQLIGIISIEDFIKCLSEGDMDAVVEDKMMNKVEVLHPDEPLVNAIGKFDEYGFGRFPVIEREKGKLVGVITKGDIIKGILKKLEIDYHEEEIRRYRASHIFEDIIADRTTLSFQYDIKSKDFDNAGESSSQLKKALRRLGIQPDFVRRSAIVAYEAEMNIVIFTHGGRLKASVQPVQIKIEASDIGPGIPDLKKALQPGYSTAPDWVRELGFGAGMGLLNIKNCADKLNIHSNAGTGTRLTAIIYI
jgi:CBS domain-containing protein/anti-sigma regulatory factor (Ser/Thr protein kinase)